MRPCIAIVLLAFLMTVSSCNLEKMGSQVTAGVNKNVEEMGRKLMSGVGRGLDDTTALRKSLSHLLDSMVFNAGVNGREAVRLLMDTLLSPRWSVFTQQLIEDATGKKLQGNVAALKETLLGPDTRQRVQLLIDAALNDVLNSKLPIAAARVREELTGLQLRNNLALIRAGLLNDSTKGAIAGIVDSAMVTFAKRMKGDVNPLLRDNLSFIQRNATTLLIVIGVIALVIVIVIWRLKQKYAKMTTLLAAQIHAIPDQKAYDDLTMRIKQNATLAGVEPKLREVLNKNGLSGENRQSWQEKKASILQNSN